ncbi:MAG: hydrogenase formation protein HypD [Clostridiales Family XIII bacterium]|jgi:hydrogenase expression/formation protein HypD|nr:hydrogenase formation protein HypD [Clostridiales Family XIII bacterium]
MKIEEIVGYLKNYNGNNIKIMEVCGTHTAAIFKNGIRSLLSPNIELISGPGCPVCVTPAAFIDRCIEYAMRPENVVLSFGDMLKAPGAEKSLAGIKGEGGNVEMIYSPLEAVSRAAANPDLSFVLAAVGFETTLPVHALVIENALERRLENLKIVTALRAVEPVLDWVARNEDGIDGYICPGHVAVITGAAPFVRLSAEHAKPFVIAGFDGEQLLAAIYAIVRMTENLRAGHDSHSIFTTMAGNVCPESAAAGEGCPESAAAGNVCPESAPMFRNIYTSAVRESGNLKAQGLIEKYFELGAAYWRGLGELPDSGYYIKAEYLGLDGGGRELDGDITLPHGCRCSDVIMGRISPGECRMFGNECRPDSPFGPCMVSSEGACGVWYQNR